MSCVGAVAVMDGVEQRPALTVPRVARHPPRDPYRWVRWMVAAAVAFPGGGIAHMLVTLGDEPEE